MAVDDGILIYVTEKQNTRTQLGRKELWGLEEKKKRELEYEEEKTNEGEARYLLICRPRHTSRDNNEMIVVDTWKRKMG